MTLVDACRRFLAVFTLALVGVVSFALALPGLVEHLAPGKPMPLPWPILIAIAIVQSAVFMAVAALAFVRLGPALGLSSPLVDSLARRELPGAATARAIVVGVGVGALGGVASALLLPAFAGYLGNFPLATRMLYGGLAEEVLFRGGFLAVVAWAGSRFLQSKALVPAIVFTDAVFVLLHLPALAFAHSPETARTVAVIFVATLPWGFLSWKLGLESAMSAHATFHGAFAASVWLTTKL